MVNAKQGWHNLMSAFDNYDNDEVEITNGYCVANYGDDVQGINLVNELQCIHGVSFCESTAGHWMYDIAGTFEVTHPSYRVPAYIRSAEGDALVEHIYSIMPELSA